MKKKFYLIGTAFLFALSIYALTYIEARDLELVKTGSHTTNAHGHLLYELTFDNVINKFSTHIALGTISGTVPLSEDKNFFTEIPREIPLLRGGMKSVAIMVWDKNIVIRKQPYRLLTII
jgi:hypothetical protein